MISGQAIDTRDWQNSGTKINNTAIINKFISVENSKPIDNLARANETAQADIGELEPLDCETTFSFVKFASDCGAVETLEAAGDAIIESADGTFSISPDLEYANLAQNDEFKKLVDSVLR